MAWAEFGFNASPNMSESEIKQLWENTQYLNNLISDLAEAKLSLDDACALSERIINPDKLIHELYGNFEQRGYL